MTRAFSGRKLWRLPRRGMVKGVCAGIAQYLDVPVKLVRLITVLAMFFGLFFFVIVAYIALCFVLDPLPEGMEPEEQGEPSCRQMLDDVDTELAASEQRLRAMERYITSDTFALHSHFRQL